MWYVAICHTWKVDLIIICAYIELGVLASKTINFNATVGSPTFINCETGSMLSDFTKVQTIYWDKVTEPEIQIYFNTFL